MASQPFLCPRGFSPKHLQDLSPLSPGFIFGALVPTASCSDTCQHYSYFLGFKIQSFSCWLVGWFFVYLTCAWFFCLGFFFFVFFFSLEAKPLSLSSLYFNISQKGERGLKCAHVTAGLFLQ